MLTKIQTMLFDLDGTLVDSRRDLTDAVNAALKAVGQPQQSQDDIIPHVGNGLRVLLNEVLGPVSDKDLNSAIRAFEQYYEPHCVDFTVLYEGVADGLAEWTKWLNLGVITNKPHLFAEKILKQLNVYSHFTVVLGGDSLAQRKPHPAPILDAIKRVNGSMDTTLIVGDGPQDIYAGQAAGIKTCAARYGYGFTAGLLELEPDYVIDRFKDLKEILYDTVK